MPADFAGRFDLIANGQWSGTLVLAVDPAGTVSGHFRSDRTAPPIRSRARWPPMFRKRSRSPFNFPRARAGL